MPRYFIDTDDDDSLVRDDEGQEFVDAHAARTAALAALPDMARDHIPDGDRRTFRVAVRTEDGTPIYSATMTLVGLWESMARS